MGDGAPMNFVATSQTPNPSIDLARVPDFDLGALRVRPARRQLCGPADECRELEPRVM